MNTTLSKVELIKKERKRMGDNYLVAKSFNMGYYLVIPILLGVFLGVAIDKVFKTESLFTTLFLFLGIISTFYNLFKIVKDGEGSSHKRKGGTTL